MPCVPDLKCGDGWKGAYGDFGTFCYKEVYEHKTWDEAHGACKQFGGELFSVKNAYEQRFLENFTNIESWIGYRYRWARDMCVSAWQIYLYQVDEGGGEVASPFLGHSLRSLISQFLYFMECFRYFTFFIHYRAVRAFISSDIYIHEMV